MATLKIYDAAKSVEVPAGPAEGNPLVERLIEDIVELYVDTGDNRIVAYVNAKASIQSSPRPAYYHVEFVSDSREELFDGLETHLELLEQHPDSRRDSLDAYSESIDERALDTGTWTFNKKEVNCSYPWVLAESNPVLPVQDNVEEMTIKSLLEDGRELSLGLDSPEAAAGFVRYVVDDTDIETTLAISTDGRGAGDSIADVQVVLDPTESSFKPADQDTAQLLNQRAENIEQHLGKRIREDILRCIDELVASDELDVHQKYSLLGDLSRLLDGEVDPAELDTSAPPFSRAVESVVDARENPEISLSKVQENDEIVEQIAEERKRIEREAKEGSVGDITAAIDDLTGDRTLSDEAKAAELDRLRTNATLLTESYQVDIPSEAQTRHGARVNGTLKKCEDRELLGPSDQAAVGEEVQEYIDQRSEEINGQLLRGYRDDIESRAQSLVANDSLSDEETGEVLHQLISLVESGDRFVSGAVNEPPADELKNAIVSHIDAVAEERYFSEEDAKTFEDDVAEILKKKRNPLVDSTLGSRVEAIETSIERLIENSESGVYKDVGESLERYRSLVAGDDPTRVNPNTEVGTKIREAFSDGLLEDRRDELQERVVGVIDDGLERVRERTKQNLQQQIRSELSSIGEYGPESSVSDLRARARYLSAVERAADDGSRSIDFDPEEHTDFEVATLERCWTYLTSLDHLDTPRAAEVKSTLFSRIATQAVSFRDDVNDGLYDRFLDELSEEMTAVERQAENDFQYCEWLHNARVQLQDEQIPLSTREGERIIDLVEQFEDIEGFGEDRYDVRAIAIKNIDSAIEDTRDDALEFIPREFSRTLEQLRTDDRIDIATKGNTCNAAKRALEEGATTISRFGANETEHRTALNEIVNTVYTADFLRDSDISRIENNCKELCEKLIPEYREQLADNVRNAVDYWIETQYAGGDHSIEALRELYSIEQRIDDRSPDRTTHGASIPSEVQQALSELEKANFLSEKEAVYEDIRSRIQGEIRPKQETILKERRASALETVQAVADSERTAAFKYEFLNEAGSVIDDGGSINEYDSHKYSERVSQLITGFEDTVAPVYDNRDLFGDAVGEFTDDIASTVTRLRTQQLGQIEDELEQRVEQALPTIDGFETLSSSEKLSASRNVHALLDLLRAFPETSHEHRDLSNDVENVASYLSHLEDTVTNPGEIETFVDDELVGSIAERKRRVRELTTQSVRDEVADVVSTIRSDDDTVRAYAALHIVERISAPEKDVGKMKSKNTLGERHLPTPEEIASDYPEAGYILEELDNLRKNPLFSDEERYDIEADLHDNTVLEAVEWAESAVVDSYAGYICDEIDALVDNPEVNDGAKTSGILGIRTCVAGSEDGKVESDALGRRDTLLVDAIDVDSEHSKEVDMIRKRLHDLATEGRIRSAELREIRESIYEKANREYQLRDEDRNLLSGTWHKLKYKLGDTAPSGSGGRLRNSVAAAKPNGTQVFLLLAVLAAVVVGFQVAGPLMSGGDTGGPPPFEIGIDSSQPGTITVAGNVGAPYVHINVTRDESGTPTAHSETFEVSSNGFSKSLSGFEPGMYNVTVFGLNGSKTRMGYRLSSTVMMEGASSPETTGTESQTQSEPEAPSNTASGTPSPTASPERADIEARDDRYETTAGRTLSVGETKGVLANDTNPNGNLTAAVIDETANGTLQFYENGSFVYNAEDAFTGTDSFAYRVSEETGATAAANVTISVTSSSGSA